jgi:hypothetical protein
MVQGVPLRNAVIGLTRGPLTRQAPSRECRVEKPTTMRILTTLVRSDGRTVALEAPIPEGVRAGRP